MNDLTLITVTLYERGFERFWLSFVVEGRQQGAVVWAKRMEDVRNRAMGLGYQNIEVRELGRDSFWAEKRQGRSFVGSESRQVLYRVETTGDWIVWPEFVEVSK
jgi:hypothetical protein